MEKRKKKKLPKTT